jgi:hypothetical protein
MFTLVLLGIIQALVLLLDLCKTWNTEDGICVVYGVLGLFATFWGFLVRGVRLNMFLGTVWCRLHRDTIESV